MATAPDELTFEEASAPAAEAPEEITFEEGHGLNPEALRAGIQASIGATQAVRDVVGSPAAAEASEMGRRQGPEARILAENQTPPVVPPREVIGPMPGREATEPFKLGDYTITPAQGGPGIPYVRPPKEAGAVEKVAAGAFNTLAAVPNFMLTLPGLATAALPAALPAKFLEPALKVGFGAMMATATEEAVRKAWKTKDPQDIAEAIGAGGFTALILKGRADPEFQAEVMKQRRLKQAGILLSDQIKRTTPPGTPRRFLVEGAEPERPLTTVTTSTGEKIQVPKGQEPKETFEAKMARMKSEQQDRIKRNMDRVADEATVVRLQHPDGRKAVVSPDPTAPGKWRLTWFTREGEPWGHAILDSRDEAIQDGLGIYGKKYGPSHIGGGYEVAEGRTPTAPTKPAAPATPAAPTGLPGLKTEKPDAQGRWRFTVDDGTGTTFTMPAGSSREAIISMGNRRTAPSIFGNLDRLDKMSVEEFTKIVKGYDHGDASNEEISRVFTEEDAPRLLEIRNKSIAEGERLQSELEGAVKSGDEKKMNEVMMAQGQHQVKAQTINEWLAKIPEVAEKLKGLDANQVKAKLQELYGPKNEVKPAEPEPATPAEPTPAATPKLSEDQVRDLVANVVHLSKSRKLTSVERAQISAGIQEARAGNPEKLQAIQRTISQAAPKIAPKIKGGDQGKFDAETEAHGEDILSFLNRESKVMPKGTAEAKGKIKPGVGDWDGQPAKLASIHHNVIYSDTGVNPTDAAQAAKDAGYLKGAKADDLWAAIDIATKKRKGAVQGAKKAGKLLDEKGPQLERWQAATTTLTEANPVEITTEEIGRNDILEVGGERIKVGERDSDGTVRLIGGDKFGEQELKEGEKIYVTKHTPAEQRPETGENIAFSMEQEHPGSEAAAGIRRNGTDTGLPPGVPDGGPDFVSELMAASQRLGTIIRTRVTMAAGTLGQYVRSRRGGVMMADKIEVGNLVNQSTIAHEMGHDIDQYLWPAIDLDYSMKSLSARAGVPGNGRELHNELMKVSTYMRGEVKGSPRYVQYRKRAAELIADHFALYAHDPALARNLAPKWTKVLEDAIARSPDAKNTIAELHAGNVTPAPGGAAQPPTGPAAGMPGRVPPVLPPPMASPEANLFHTGAGLVKGLIRKFKEKVIQAQIVADRWNRIVPDKADRNDVGAFVEGTGNLEIPGDAIDAVKARMTPAKYKMVKLYKTAIETVRGEINAYMHGMTDGEYLDFIKDYLPHFYDTKSSKGQAALGNFLKNSPNAKQRKIPTLQEALTFGLTPITQDPAVLYQLHSRINWRVATNRMLIGELGKMKTANGDPVLLPWGKAPIGYIRSDNPLIQRTYAMQSKGATQLWRGGAGVHPDAWLAVRQMLETPTDSTLAQYYDVFNSLTRANAFAFSAFHDVTLRAAASGTGILGASGAKYLNPFRGLFRVLEKNPLSGELEMFSSTRKLGKQLLQDEAAAMDAARHGLVFSWNDSDSYQMNARDFLDRQAAKWREHPLAGPATRWARDFQHWRQQGLWKNTHDAYKIIAFHDLSSKALRDAPPGTNPTVVKEQIASLLNDAFGGQEWQTKFWLSPANRRVLARFFLAPDWTLSTLRSVPGASDLMSTVRQTPRLWGGPTVPTEFEGMGGNWKRARFWGAEVAALAIGTLATQYAIHHAFGDKNKGDKEWTWENEYGQRSRVDLTPIMRKLPWKDKNDPTRYYLNLAKRPQELVGWFIQPEKNIYSKLARPVAEVMRQITGMEGDFPTQWKRDHETFIESIPQRALKAAGTAVPFTFSGNQFAMSLPYRKGMTKYKAQQAFESVYELQADPGVWPAARAFLRGVPNPQGTMREMVEQLSYAAERNGVPAEKIRVRALSVIRGKYNGQFEKASKALDANPHDKKAMKDLEKASEALHNLGSSGRQIYESMKRRQELAPREP